MTSEVALQVPFYKFNNVIFYDYYISGQFSVNDGVVQVETAFCHAETRVTTLGRFVRHSNGEYLVYDHNYVYADPSVRDLLESLYNRAVTSVISE